MPEDFLAKALSGFSTESLGEEYRSGDALVIQGRELERYGVGESTIIIVNQDGVGRYVVVEPALTNKEKDRLSTLLRHLYLNTSPEDAADPSKRMTQNIVEAARRLGLLEELMKSLPKYEYYMKRELGGYGRLDVLMRDQNLEDIKCVGSVKPIAVKHKKYTEFDWLRTNVAFATEEETENATQKMLQRCGKMATTALPIVDARTPENHRVSVRWGHEVSMTGTAFTIRKFPSAPMAVTYLVHLNTVSPLVIAYLWLTIEAKGFVMALGPTGSGKTTFMNTLISLINPNSAVCTVEDNPELVIPHEIWDRLVSRKGYSITGSNYDIDLQDLVKHTLRLTPDFVVVGEVRGEEVQALVQSAATGHGAMTSLHSDSVQNALIRMSSPPMNVPLGNLMLIWAFVILNKVRREGGKVVRRMISVTELQPRMGGLDEKEIFSYDVKNDTFAPSSPEELVNLKSVRMQQVMHLFGWSEDDLVRELSERTAFVEEMVADRMFDLTQVSERIEKFYLVKYGLTPQ